MFTEFQSSTTLEYALHYASMGYRVLPLVANEKRPACPHGVKDATTDESMIRKWFTGTDYNIGIACYDIFVIDCDLYKYEGLDKWVPMLNDENVPTQKSPRGGMHFVYKRPEQCNWDNSANKIEKGVDTKTNDGYIAAFPSTVDGNEYRWVYELKPINELPLPPDWLCQKIDFIFSEEYANLPKPNNTKRQVAETPVVDRARKYLAAMPPAISGSGGHSATYAAAVALVHGFELSDETAFNLLWNEYNPRCEPPWSVKDLQHKVDDAAKEQHEKPRGWLNKTKIKRKSVHIDRGASTLENSFFHKDVDNLTENQFRAPGFISDYIDACLEGAPYPSITLAFCGAVAMQSILIARKIQDSSGIRGNIYITALANAGSGKDYPRKVNNHILTELGLEDCTVDQLASGQGLYDAIGNDPYYILCQTDEIDSLLRSLGKSQNSNMEGIFAALLNLYSASQSIVAQRKKVGNTKRPVIQQPYLTIFGTATPKLYYESLNEQLLTNGFFARTMIFHSEKRPMGKEGKPVEKISEKLIEHAAKWNGYQTKYQQNPKNGNLREMICSPDILDMTNEAEEKARQFQHKCDIEYQIAEDNTDVPAMSIWGRANENMRKLAIIYACSESPELPQIRSSSIEWASQIVNFQVRKQLHLAERYADTSEFGRLIEKAKGFIKRWNSANKHRELTTRDFYRGMKLRKMQFDELIEEMQLRGILSVESKTVRGGTVTTVQSLLK